MRQFSLKSLNRDVDVKPMYILTDKVTNNDDILRTPNGSDLADHIIGPHLRGYVVELCAPRHLWKFG